MQKGFAPILILVGILVLGLMAGGAYYFGKSFNKSIQYPLGVAEPDAKRMNEQSKKVMDEKNNADETANWNTYVNKEVGISFKYPVNWITKPYKFDGYKTFHAIIELDSENQSEQRPAPGLLTFAYWDNSDNLSLEQFEKKYTGNSGFGPGVYSTKAEQKTVNGTTAYYQKDAICEPLYCDKYIIPYKSKIFVFTSFDVSRGIIFNQILSTFKFTN